MMNTVEILFSLQQIDFGPTTNATNQRADDLRRLLPITLLAKYDRMTLRGRRMVSLVRAGVCTECHMRLPVGTLFELSRGNPCCCDNCDRILYQPRAAAETQPVPALAEVQN